jgi:hypothetical protein
MKELLNKIENYLLWLLYNKPIPKPKKKKAKVKELSKFEKIIVDAIKENGTKDGVVGRIWFDEIDKNLKLRAKGGRKSNFYLPAGENEMYSHWLIDYSASATLPVTDTIYKLIGFGKKPPVPPPNRSLNTNETYEPDEYHPTASVSVGSSGTAGYGGTQYGSSGTSGYFPTKKKEVGIPKDVIEKELLNSRDKLVNRLPSDLIRKKYSIGLVPERSRKLESIPAEQNDLVKERIIKLDGIKYRPARREQLDNDGDLDNDGPLDNDGGIW